jgi:tetratricopeptide (TPR) repeat protein
VTNFKNLLAGLLVATIFLSACSSTPEKSTETSTEKETIKAASDSSETAVIVKPEPVYRPFPEETLYALLVAEFAAKRQHYDIALGHYLDQAHKTRDAGVAARATHLANFVKAHRAAMDASLLWASLEPDNIEANYLAAVNLSRNRQPETALSYMLKVEELGGNTNFAIIAASSEHLDSEQRTILIADYDLLLTSHPDSTDLLIGKSILLQQANQQEEALQAIQKVLSIEPEHLRAIILEATLLLQTQPNKAFVRIESLLEKYPNNQRLRLQYARLLTRVDLVRAQQQFFILAEQNPSDPDLIFSLALIYKENALYGDAEERFKQLLQLDKRSSEAHFYLGLLAERKGELAIAESHYRQVTSGPDYLPAVKQLTRIMLAQQQSEKAITFLANARQENPQEASQLYLLQADLLIELEQMNRAHRLLSEALTESPDNARLLYARSMVSEKRNDLAMMEQDLRAILAINPNSSLALNALGYVLADRTNRLDEAEQLITKALALNPEDPAILDSIGWLRFRQGRNEEALEYIKTAISKYPDQEVAAHLGEILWTMGQREQAKVVWRNALDRQPNSPVIQRVLQRLNVQLDEPETSSPANETTQ